jgi:hypothetical protein
MRIIFITLECADPVFSGNGISLNTLLNNIFNFSAGTYSRSLINSLLHHNNVEVFVISASPLSTAESKTAFPTEWVSNPLFHYHVITVPKEKWYRHDIISFFSSFFLSCF